MSTLADIHFRKSSVHTWSSQSSAFYRLHTTLLTDTQILILLAPPVRLFALLLPDELSGAELM